MPKSQWEIARPNDAKLQNILDYGCNWEEFAKSLLAWLSDDEVGEFAQAYGYFDGLEDEDDETEEK